MGTGEERFPFRILQVDDRFGIVDGSIILAVRPIPDDPDRDVRIPIPGIHDVRKLCRRQPAFIQVDGQQADLAGIQIPVEQIQRQRIIHIIAQVRLEDDGERRLPFPGHFPAARGQQQDDDQQ